MWAGNDGNIVEIARCRTMDVVFRWHPWIPGATIEPCVAGDVGIVVGLRTSSLYVAGSLDDRVPFFYGVD